jgi:glycosyltransferase involved in cell wall biosynthesis
VSWNIFFHIKRGYILPKDPDGIYLFVLFYDNFTRGNQGIMKVLFITQHDPYAPDLASGSDYNYLRAVQNNGFEVKVIGPFISPPIWLERMFSRVYQRSGKRYLKYKMTHAWVASKATNMVVDEWQPNIIFTHYTSPLVFYHGGIPCVYRTDSTFYGVNKDYPLYGKLALWIEIWQERQAFRHSARVITHSEWSGRILADYYRVPKNRIVVYPEPSALPAYIVPNEIKIHRWKALKKPIRLLLVGRDYHRKGIDIAIEVVHRLNIAGIPAELIVCGTQGQADEFVRFVGPFKKSVAHQLEQYVDLYRKAHLLIHPAIFDAGPIVTAEAASFGTPTITNNAGGLGTSVKDGISGIVLPKWSPPEAYVKAITELVENPERYYRLCQRSRERYEKELNWGVVEKRFGEVLRQVVQEYGSNGE